MTERKSGKRISAFSLSLPCRRCILFAPEKHVAPEGSGIDRLGREYRFLLLERKPDSGVEAHLIEGSSRLRTASGMRMV